MHVRRIPGLIENAIRNGPDGSLDDKFKNEHPIFTNTIVGFYLAGSLAYLEGEDGSYSWNTVSPSHADFDAFTDLTPTPRSRSFKTKGVSKLNLDALACIRNAVIHHDGDLSLNRDTNSLAKVRTANLPGVLLNGSVVTLGEEFLEFVRISIYAVRMYYGES